MKSLLILLACSLAGCSTVNCNFTGDNNRVSIEVPKTISTSPSVTASGNTVPVSAIP